MKHIGTPAMRLTPQSIVRSFWGSEKKHLFLTGTRGSGKSMLAGRLSKLLAKEGTEMPGITTRAIPQEGIILEENISGRQAKIGIYAPLELEEGGLSPAAEGQECGRMRPVAEGQRESGMSPAAEEQKCGRMRPVAEGLIGLGKEALERCAARPGREEWVCIDELGYVETGCAPFCDAVSSLLDQKRVLAVLRGQETPFLDALRAREDVFVYNLDNPLPPVGAVIMASGLGRRFGANKLLEELDGKPLIGHVLEQTEEVFAHRVVVTRHQQIVQMCREREIDYVLHALPDRSDTVRLGVEFLQRKYGTDAIAGYLFCPSDQPFLTQETLGTMLLTYAQLSARDAIVRLSYEGRPGAPVLFGSAYGEELCLLPQGKGGSWLIQKYPHKVCHVEVLSQWELQDVDTPEDLQACRVHANSFLPSPINI